MRKVINISVAFLFVFFLTACAADETDEVTTYTLDEVAQHSTAEDCWMVIDGKVYDFSEYIPEHPAGDGMARACGGDGSGAYEGVGHSEFADSLLDEYYLGDLAATE